jgi:pyridoxal phosphate enzyme (YggS family)
MFLPFDTFSTNLELVRAQMAEACSLAGRSLDSVKLLPVTKNHPVDAVNYVARAGMNAVGENRVQEGISKQTGSPASIRWELIGHLQSNKAKLAVSHFSVIQSVDSVKLLNCLDKAASEQNKSLSILLEINAGRDPAKFGAEIEEAPALLEAALKLSSLKVEGLMTIAPLSTDKEVARRCFATLRELRDSLSTSFAAKLPVLSMGMSGDLVDAIKEGSTLVRVGSALFGART